MRPQTAFGKVFPRFLPCGLYQVHLQGICRSFKVALFTNLLTSCPNLGTKDDAQIVAKPEIDCDFKSLKRPVILLAGDPGSPAKFL
jgi:hypothetical protein